MSRRALGKTREMESLGILQKMGFRVLRQNYQKRLGEIDIIALDLAEDVLAFIEVRTRGKSAMKTFGSPLLSLNQKKIRNIKKTAQYFLLENPEWLNKPLRFDFLYAVENENREFQWDLLKNAF